MVDTLMYRGLLRVIVVVSLPHFLLSAKHNTSVYLDMEARREIYFPVDVLHYILYSQLYRSLWSFMSSSEAKRNPAHFLKSSARSGLSDLM